MQENIKLSKYTSFRIGGLASFFVDVKTDDDFLTAFKFSKEKNLPFLILGGGTNMLISDKGFPGVVIRSQGRGLTFEDHGENGLIISDTGNVLPIINQFANQNGLVGFEKLATVPGTLGGAIYNNAHWKDDLLSNHVQWVEVIDPIAEDISVKRLNIKELDFKYDSSLVKTKNLIALRAAILLPKGDVAESKKTYTEYLKTRTESQPYGTLNSGCMFQNVTQNLGPGNHGTSAGYLIDQVGLKGLKIGGAQISEKHGNFFINTGDATSDDILKLAETCRQRVKEKFGVELEFEVKIV